MPAILQSNRTLRIGPVTEGATYEVAECRKYVQHNQNLRDVASVGDLFNGVTGAGRHCRQTYFRDLLVDIGRMLSECFPKDSGTFSEAADMSVRDWGALSEAIESVARKYGFADTTGTTDQGMCGVGPLSVAGTHERADPPLTRGASAPAEVDVFENPEIDGHDR